MNTGDFLSITIVGVFLSTLYQIVKANVQSDLWNRTIILIASLLLGAGYVWLRNTNYFATVVLILGVASAIYAMIFSKMEGTSQ